MGRKVLEGESVSVGIGMGKIYIIKDADIIINEELIGESEVEKQITDLEVAICKTFIEIYDLKDGFKGILSEEEDRIFEFYKAILDDRTFFEEIKDAIKTKKYRAEKAIHTCIQKYMDEILESNNEYVKQRVFDLNDVRKRLIKNISGDNEIKFGKINSDHIVLVKELTPIIATALSKRGVKGIAAKDGAGYFTHASIILRSAGIPTLNGICLEEFQEFEDDFAIVDCEAGKLIINPSKQDKKMYKFSSFKKAGIKSYHKTSDAKDVIASGPILTLDGRRVRLMANISSVEEFSLAKKLNIDGIGLVRTESLFINYKKIPDEKRQYLIYSKIARDMANKPVVIRTADIGGDKMPDTLGINEQSLSRSSRGIKRSLEQKEEIVTQIRAIIRASEFGDISITFPMVDTAEQIKEVKKIIDNVDEELASIDKRPRKAIRTGALIETESSVQNLKEILKEVDFISIGTNDLMHQICDQNRKCSTLEKRSYLEPVLLETIQYCIKSAVDNNKTASICGEMATDPMAVIILLGMGAHDLSMSPASITNIYNFIRRVSFIEAKDIAKKAVQSGGLEEVKNMLSEWLESRM